ncbi:1,4-dihydroxy-2-naphthoate polyprenyltransferase [Parabacteroides pacaensis]|uniref:1,4-dihydroxy-2-naphthoate polyprenyltransferase n=1 Tax=Parabacteroides pacaensis TaxID=2086575 RepID=UPI000D1000E7|nr:1,4-dihydroxy-2-naphthoate polyprenyltransferase [Parabacteroides pacaensis]
MTRMQAWLEAARPKTLTASLSPVLLGIALAVHDGVFHLVPAILCLLVGISAQIASNLANDYFDYKKGADQPDRLGPARAVASGWIAPQAMLLATIKTLAFTCLCGMGLLFFAGWELLGVGIAIVIFALAYSAGPFPLAYNGLGDICVLLFYGIVPVCFTYYVQAHTFTWQVFILSLALGFLSINILVINNYRDYEQDKKANKRTTVVLFGKKFAIRFYLINLILALICGFVGIGIKIESVLLLGFCTLLFYFTWKEMNTKIGTALNRTLAHTARNVLIYAFVLSVSLLLTVNA